MLSSSRRTPNTLRSLLASASVAALTALAFAIAPQAARAQIVLTPGTILGVDIGVSFNQRVLVQYSPNGTILQNLTLTGVPVNVGSIDGLTLIGSNAYVTGTGGGVGQVNLTTGAVTGLFQSSSSSGAEALGHRGSNLLVGDFQRDTIFEYTTSGTLVNTIALANNPGITGVEWSGTKFYVGSYNTGNIFTYDVAGALTGTIVTGIGSNSISDLDFDVFSNTLYVSNGFGDDTIRQYSTTGTLLSSFASQRSNVDSLAVVPTVVAAAAPEPGTLPLVGMGLVSGLGTIANGRRRKAAKKAA